MMTKRSAETLAECREDGYLGLRCVTSFKMRFCNNAPGTSKSASGCRRGRPDSVRRSGFDRAILPPHPVAGRALAACPIRSAKQPLQYQRISEGSALPAGSGSGANRNHRAAALQRRVSLPGRLAGLSRSHQLSALPRTVRSCGTQGLVAVARPLADSHARTTSPGDLRSGQHGADGLWASGTSRGGLQPQEARAPLVPSTVVLRGEHAGLLGGQLPSRRHPRLNDHDPPVGACLRQIARTDPRSKSSCGWSVLRSQNPRIYRGKRGFLRDRGPAHPPAEKPTVGTALPSRLVGSVGGGVSVLPAWVARAATLRSDPSAGARRTFGAVAPVSDGWLQLSALGDQPELDAAASLALLQPAGARRVDHPRTEGWVCSGKDPDQRLRGERGLLPDRVVGLQPAQLVQATLCPGASATGHLAALAAAVVRGSIAVGAARRHPHLAHRAELPLRCRLPRNTAAHPPVAVAVPGEIRQPMVGTTPDSVPGPFRSSFSRVEERRGY